MSHGGGGCQQEKQKKTVDAGTSGEEEITCGGRGTAKSMDLQALPEGCIAIIVSLTTPRDACSFSAVSRSFMSAAESDPVWDKFLLHHNTSELPQLSSKKKLYLTLCEYPALLDNGKMITFLDKWSGKICYMISARDLMIANSDPHDNYWKWKSVADSRFEEVAKLRFVWTLKIRGKIETRILSPSTVYQAYLVFKLSAKAYGFDHYKPLEVTVGHLGEEEASSKRTVFLDQEEVGRRRQKTPDGTSETQYPKKRTDGWLEVEMGEFFCPGEEDGAIIEMTCMEVKSGTKRGLIVQGIEVRPKRMKKVSYGAFSIA